MNIIEVRKNITSFDVVSEILGQYIEQGLRVGMYPLSAETHYSKITNLLDLSQVRSFVIKNSSESSWHEFRKFALTDKEEYALISQVGLGVEGDVYQLPFLDLQIPDDASALEKIVVAIECVPPPCKQLYLCRSGTSFHLYGDVLVRASEWYAFLGTALTWRYRDVAGDLKYLVDVARVGHALARGVGTIRLHARKSIEYYEVRLESTLIARLQ